ncbi:hypothetical protein [Speluncibacter jeojiensis]|uniref:Uncharacterized protein n=1 Tax=Speluncibacter jeojiensis TaxID=2710754 RepID=A0A9X4RHM7_9ACTN|nr:hypothetical protein [Corynebacteriales bacterium D3-21]
MADYLRTLDPAGFVDAGVFGLGKPALLRGPTAIGKLTDCTEVFDVRSLERVTFRLVADRDLRTEPDGAVAGTPVDRLRDGYPDCTLFFPLPIAVQPDRSGEITARPRPVRSGVEVAGLPDACGVARNVVAATIGLARTVPPKRAPGGVLTGHSACEVGEHLPPQVKVSQLKASQDPYTCTFALERPPGVSLPPQYTVIFGVHAAAEPFGFVTGHDYCKSIYRAGPVDTATTAWGPAVAAIGDGYRSQTAIAPQIEVQLLAGVGNRCDVSEAILRAAKELFIDAH